MKSFLPNFSGAAGAAFLLRTPARKGFTFQHGAAVIVIRAGGIYATVGLPDIPSDYTLRTRAWQVLQEALDIYALTHHEILATSYGNREYLLWTLGHAGYELTCVDTMDMPWFMSARGKTGCADFASVVTSLPYHPSFRFYRLSHLTDDLFDAYRNAYLCLECLVSEESPKMMSESEIIWLKRVLENSLSPAIPAEMDVNATIDEIYELGRLPLFHAKTGRIFHVPQGEERERIQSLFEQLMLLLAALLRYKFGNRFSADGTGMAQNVHDAQPHSAFQFDKVVYKYGNKQFSAVPKIEIAEKPRRLDHLQVWLDVEKPRNLTWVDEIDLLYKGEPRCRLRFPEYVPLTQISKVRFEFNLLQYNPRSQNLPYAV